jgi:hypothetical protein
VPASAESNSFGLSLHQSFDVARDGCKAKPTATKLRGEGPAAGQAEFERLLDAWFGNAAHAESFFVRPPTPAAPASLRRS